MRSFRCVWDIARQNIRKWQTDYRIWIIAILAFVFMARVCKDFRIFAQSADVKTPLWVFPFLYTSSSIKPQFILPVALLFCNAPFTDRNQMFVIMRAGRTKWFLGQLLYIIIASALYFLFLFLSSFVIMSFTSEFSGDWGILLYSKASGAISTPAANSFYFESSISSSIIRYFTPLNACWYTFLMSWLMGVMIGILMFFFNLLTKTKACGFICSAFLMVIDIVAHRIPSLGYKLYYISPVSWCTMNNIDVGKLTTKPGFTYCLCGYLILIAAMTAGILIFGRKKSLDTRGD